MVDQFPDNSIEERRKKKFSRRLQTIALSGALSLVFLIPGLPYAQYISAKSVIDFNKNGKITKNEWKEACKLTKLTYDPKTFPSIWNVNGNISIVGAYDDGKFSEAYNK